MSDSGPAKGAQPFDRDAVEHGGYLYADPDRFSACVANARMTQAILESADFAGRRVIDVGCGDGTYTRDLIDAGAASVLGVDAAPQAIELARTKNIPRTTFAVSDLTDLTEVFDIALVRGVIHHLDDVQPVIDVLCRIARTIVIVEPNGYNPGLKILEKVSRYHREHGERSYAPRRINAWFTGRGCTVERTTFVGLVPMFSPDAMARVLKRIEPVIEGTPLLRMVCCAQYVVSIRT
jgi:SAM-dependent methyltransferase